MIFGFQPKRVAFSLFGLDVMWYGVMIALAIGVAIIVCYYRAPKHGITSDRALNYMLVGIPMGIIGARIYYVIFMWDLYKDNLLSIVNLRTGGLAVQGGLILALLAVLLMSKIWKDKPLELFDLAAPSLAIGQAIGRWGNFFNMEAYGSPTDLPWALYIDGVHVHPTFLYESLWCFALFFFLIYKDKRRKFVGQTILLYAILYSIERFFVEGLRVDSLMIGTFRQAQVLSLLVIIFSVIIYVLLKKRSAKER